MIGRLGGPVNALGAHDRDVAREYAVEFGKIVGNGVCPYAVTVTDLAG